MQKRLRTVEEMFLEAEGCDHAADGRRSAEGESNTQQLTPDTELRKRRRHLDVHLVMALKRPRILALCRATKAGVKMTPLL